MANTTLNTRVICKVDTAAKWASSSLVLLKGEIAIEADTRKFKIGDGVKTFSQLEYAAQLPTKISTQNPSVTDTGYEVGSLWMNSTDGSTYILQTNDAEPTWVKLAKFSDLAAGDFGDMHARDYDTDGNGSVDKADTLKNSDGSFLSVNDSNTDGLWTASKTNQTITEGLALKADKSDTYTKTEVDGKLDLKANAADVYNKGEVDGFLAVKADKTELNNYIPLTQKGAVDGVATLDGSGKIPTSQLPSYVSDVIEADSQSAFPPAGEVNKIYVAKDTNKTYRWSGTQYVEISASIALGETSQTAYAGDKGKQNADNIATLQGQVSSIQSTLDGLGNLATKDTVSAAEIDANAVTTEKILDANVTEAKLADSAVTGAKIATGAVTDDKIVSMDAKKLTQTAGDVIILNCGDSTDTSAA